MGRTYLGERFINLEIVQNGFAWRFRSKNLLPAGTSASSGRCLCRGETNLRAWLEKLAASAGEKILGEPFPKAPEPAPDKKPR